MPNPFSVIDKMYFCLATISDFFILSADPFFSKFFAIFGFTVDASSTDNEITLSSLANSIPLMPFDDQPLNILSFLDINLMHLPK